jgi:chemotaxis protein methyltransferase CheR
MEAQEYRDVKREVLKLTGVDMDCYKAPQVQRRLRTFLTRSGYPTWPHFFRAMRDDPVALGKLKDCLTINVSSFFRDPDKFDYMRESVLPELLRNHPRLRVWSAGCSHGPEPYSLAIMLVEATGPYRRHCILATDIDHSALERSRAGGPYGAEELENVPPLLERYFEADEGEGGYRAIEPLRRMITFRYHNLLLDPFESELDLIVCRNVAIYFTAQVKDRLYRRFHDALRPGGVLFVGGTECLSQASDMGFERVGISFYRRSDA